MEAISLCPKEDVGETDRLNSDYIRVVFFPFALLLYEYGGFCKLELGVVQFSALRFDLPMCVGMHSFHFH